MPGYTHVQQAQPVYIGHYLLSFFWALERDKSRLRHACASAGQMPLGSGALAGSAFPYEREMVAARLGFPELSPNSIDATAHRDWALEFLGASAILGCLLSTYAEDFVLWSTQEFAYIELGEAYTSGSSMMPQKKNPDSMELIRGKSGRLLGNFTRLFTVMKGLPHAYDRDLQEDKEPVFDSVETLGLCLTVMAEAIGTLKFRTGRNRTQDAPGNARHGFGGLPGGQRRALPRRASHRGPHDRQGRGAQGLLPGASRGRMGRHPGRQGLPQKADLRLFGGTPQHPGRHGQRFGQGAIGAGQADPRFVAAAGPEVPGLRGFRPIRRLTIPYTIP